MLISSVDTCSCCSYTRDAIKIRNGVMFDFYLELIYVHVCVYMNY